MTIVNITSDFDASVVADLRPLFEKLAAGELDVSIDMTKTDFMDPSGVGAVAFLYKRLNARGRRLSLVGVQGQPLLLLRKLWLASLLAEKPALPQAA